MADKLRTIEIQNTFRGRQAFNLKELRRFYADHEPALNENTLLSRIYYLKKKGIIHVTGKGRYTLDNRSGFQLVPGEAEKEWYGRISWQFPHIRSCVWSTASLDNWLGIPLGKPLILVEVDREAIVTIFDLLREYTTSIFLSPDRTLLQRYVPMHENPVILVPLITEAPLDEIEGIPVPPAEKLIVDIMSEPGLLSRFQGKVMRDFITRVIRKHRVNHDRLGRYAARRNKKGELQTLLKELSLKGAGNSRI